MPDKRGVYLDSCCFIDMVKEAVGQHLENERATDVWFLKQLTQACRDGELDAFTSVLTIAECTSAGDDVSAEVKGRFNDLLMSGQYVKLIQPTPFIASDARDLRWKQNIIVKGADGLHIASALELKCEEFLTTDGNMKKTAAKPILETLGMRMIRPSETNCLPAKYRQTQLEGLD
jgi:predicted nucleic acid-binding protein